MSRHLFTTILLLVTFTTWRTAQADDPPSTRPAPPVAPTRPTATAGEPSSACEPVIDPFADRALATDHLVASIHGLPGHEKITGVVHLRRVDGQKVSMEAEISGLPPGAHGFHLHVYGDCSSAEASGPHYNLTGPSLGAREVPGVVHGDLGELSVPPGGKVVVERTVPNASMSGPAPLHGRAVIVHARGDDGSAPGGGTSARLACGVLGIAEPESQTTGSLAPELPRVSDPG